MTNKPPTNAISTNDKTTRIKSASAMASLPGQTTPVTSPNRSERGSSEPHTAAFPMHVPYESIPFFCCCARASSGLFTIVVDNSVGSTQKNRQESYPVRSARKSTKNSQKVHSFIYPIANRHFTVAAEDTELNHPKQSSTRHPDWFG